MPLISPVYSIQVECQCCASPVGVSRSTEYPSTMVFRFSSDQNSILGSNMLSGGLISEGKRTVTLELVP